MNNTNDTTLTPEEKALLQQIVNDKFAIGPFSGMIFNAAMEELRAQENYNKQRQLQDASYEAPEPQTNIDVFVKHALHTRLRLQKLAE